MKKLFVAAVASTAFVSSTALAAPSDSDSFVINATVEEACTMQGINDINLGNLAVNLAAGADALLISSNAQAETSSFWVSCNAPNGMTLSADPYMQGSRTLQSGDDAGFTDRINYRVGARGYLDDIASSSGPRYVSASNTYFHNGTQRGAVHRQIQMRATVLQNENALRPLAGNYTANVTVTVSTM